MRVISKKLSYNGLVSRVPGVVPSIMDSWKITNIGNCIDTDETYYSYSQAVNRAAEYNINASSLQYEAEFITFNKDNLNEFSIGNYGLIPSDVIIPKEIAGAITDYTDIYVNIPDGEGGYYDLSWPKNGSDPHYEGRRIISGDSEVKILTYHTLNKWYVFFKQYYELLSNPSHIKVYSSATDYYETEYETKTNSLRSRFEELDNLYEARGGENMYNWIVSNCIIQFNIPSKYTDEWKCTYLYYPQAIKWYSWFKERSEKYEGIATIGECKKAEDCCDCTEYIRLGGKDFMDELEAWLSEITFSCEATNSASLVLPLCFTNSIDDLGEMTIFSSKWQEEVDYHNTLNEKGYEQIEGITGGTVVHQPYLIDDSGNTIPLNDTYMIRDDRRGYEYNDYYENAFVSGDWVSYTDYVINHYESGFASNGIAQNGNLEPVTSYTYSPINGKVIYNPNIISASVSANFDKVVCINGNPYEVINGKYVELCYDSKSIASIKYKQHIKLPVFKDGDLEYAVMNGRKKYVVKKNVSERNGRIYFLKESDCHDEGCIVKEGKYVIYNDCLYLVENNKVTISEPDVDNNTYFTKVLPVLDGYFEYSGNTFFISGDTIVVQIGSLYDDSNTSLVSTFIDVNDGYLGAFEIDRMVADSENGVVILFYKFTPKRCDIISGYCDSKLELLRRKEITVDDIGNELPGYFKSIVDVSVPDGNQSPYNNPYDECTLDILYVKNDVSELEKLDESVFGEFRYHGNIIDEIKFYYKKTDGTMSEISSATTGDNAVEVIEACMKQFDEYDGFDIDDKLLCDITYYIGATIEKVDDEYHLVRNLHNGVKYVDTVKVTKLVGSYYMNKYDTFTFNYYRLERLDACTYLSDFNDTTSYGNTYFEFVPYQYHYGNRSDDNSIEKPNDVSDLFNGWADNNNMMVAPLIRTEFNLASSLPQIIDADIYIDRGVNSAFDRHLKLQEIRTLEALENYGNSYFKINKY